MNAIIENLLNGNLADAKNAAKRHEMFSLARFAQENFGMERNTSIMTAAFLKGRCTFQAYCDATAKETASA